MNRPLKSAVWKTLSLPDFCGSLTGQGEKKRSTFTHPGLSPDASAMTMNDSLDTGQTHPGSFELLIRVQPLENAQEFPSMFHVKTRAVIPDKVNPFPTLLPPTHSHDEIFLLARQ